jgi:hypothetical protein
MKRALLVVAMALVLLYTGDYLSVRYRIPNREPLGTVKIQRYYAVRQKDRKTEYYFLEPETRQCVHSLFPQMGFSPCWYLSRQTKQEINM